MYLEYYGLEQPPFSITPDPHYVFLSEQHRDALAHLLYGIQQGGSGGFVQLTGEVGTGKTTLSRLLLNQLPKGTHAALVLNPRLEPIELMETICEELGLRPGTPVHPEIAPPQPIASTSASKRKQTTTSKSSTPSASRSSKRRAKPTAKSLYDQLSAYLLQTYARGERVVLIIDEAQNLSTEALEQVRLLTNLETETQKLLQIILIGQPELREMLMRPELRQLAQRITARYHLRPLDEAGTASYLRHRLNIAGTKRFPFSEDAVRRLHQRSGGVPRLINIIAERALLGGYAHDLLTVDAKTVERAAAEALAPTSSGSTSRDRILLRSALSTAAIATLAALLMAWPILGSRTENTQHKATPAQIAPPHASTASPTIAPSTQELDTLRQRLRASAPNTNSEWLTLVAAFDAPAALRKTSADACPATPATGWRCLRSRATLDQLLRFDRPVLLRLRAEPHAAWSRLLAASGTRVRLSHDGRTFDIDRVALAGVWNGEYLAIWPAPDALETRYAAGDAEAVAWLRERLLRAASGSGTKTNSLTSTSDRESALRAFQTQHGLAGDGRLHPDTLFALAARDDGPRLSDTGIGEAAE
jgi:general secretion pathway protein A